MARWVKNNLLWIFIYQASKAKGSVKRICFFTIAPHCQETILKTLSTKHTLITSSLFIVHCSLFTNQDQPPPPKPVIISAGRGSLISSNLFTIFMLLQTHYAKLSTSLNSQNFSIFPFSWETAWRQHKFTDRSN